MKTKINSIGLEKNPKDTTVVVAMSGGVDSSTVAGMMKKDGYKVIGITLKLYDDTKQTAKSKQCCAGQDIMDAKRVADKLDIDHKILYYQSKFKQGVVDNFVESYLAGETPIPCVQCNQTVKFKDLFEESKNLNADALITGHYVKSVTHNDETNMYRAVDENRDQSYFLFNTTREQLNYLRFPLGGMMKDETRQIAKNLNLNVNEIIDNLTKVKGVGLWTAQMFLMFTLNRPDIFPATDLAMQKGFRIYFSLENLPNSYEMINRSQQWIPYRTTVSLYLWSVLEGPFEW